MTVKHVKKHVLLVRHGVQCGHVHWLMTFFLTENIFVCVKRMEFLATDMIWRFNLVKFLSVKKEKDLYILGCYLI